MDFFAAQDSARRSTGWLIVLFLLAVLSLIIMTNLLVVVVTGLSSTHGHAPSLAAMRWDTFLLVGGGVCLVVAGGTWYKMSALSSGGDAVAQMMGAQPVFADDEEFASQVLVNVVEEMALASGVPVPQVYVLDEQGINAFAAGLTTSDAVVAVTKGALQHLNREQLQGVIAHEFSHILNGDMRLNIRLIGILHGILLLGLIGRSMLHGGSRSSRKNSGGGLLLGLGLIVIGYTGMFFGNMIKAAVGRQREFLADASAVQFTRNPEGIGGALLQIGANQAGSLVKNPKSEEISHAFFSQGVKLHFSSPFATHPPLAIRIKRILPQWDGTFPQALPAETGVSRSGQSSLGTAAFAGAHTAAQQAEPGAINIPQGRHLLATLPEAFKKAARDPFASRAVIAYLALAPDEEARQRQLTLLRSVADRGVHAETLRLLRLQITLTQELKLPLLELTLPTLRRLSTEQAYRFLETLDALIREDKKITVFEWCLRAIVSEHLREYFDPSSSPPLRGGLQEVAEDCRVLFSLLCQATKQNEATVERLFSQAMEALALPVTPLLPATSLGIKQLDAALHRLRRLEPKVKAQLFRGCQTIALADERITATEAELLRAVAATLAIPLPPS